MAQPTYAQYRNLRSSSASLTPEDLMNRWLTCLAVMASQQNPDGSSFVHP